MWDTLRWVAPSSEKKKSTSKNNPFVTKSLPQAYLRFLSNTRNKQKEVRIVTNRINAKQQKQNTQEDIDVKFQLSVFKLISFNHFLTP